MFLIEIFPFDYSHLSVIFAFISIQNCLKAHFNSSLVYYSSLVLAGMLRIVGSLLICNQFNDCLSCLQFMKENFQHVNPIFLQFSNSFSMILSQNFAEPLAFFVLSFGTFFSFSICNLKHFCETLLFRLSSLLFSLPFFFQIGYE